MSEDLEAGQIVVVDDDHIYARSLHEVLKFHGFRSVQLFFEPKAALERLLKDPCDLLILDLHMPGMTGLEVIAQLHKAISIEDMFPVLILTGDGDPGFREAALALGTMDYLTKPFRRTEVLLRVRNLLRMRLLHKQVRSHATTLEQRVEERTKEVSEAHLDTVRRLAQAAEFRDDATGRHIQRVGAMAAAIAEQLEAPPSFCRQMQYAAQLHDIGKIGVADAILLKPGRLSPEEFAAMKRHTIIGARILRDSPSELLRLSSEIALTHHERWDGAGYPRRLRGSAIPLSGRITAVADVFDALLHERPYKQAWHLEDALNEVDAQEGRMFDPEVVAAFRRVIAAPPESLEPLAKVKGVRP